MLLLAVVRALLQANYRSSNLTRLLADSLGGSASTLLIACIHAKPDNGLQTRSTLEFASRARLVKNVVIEHVGERILLLGVFAHVPWLSRRVCDVSVDEKAQRDFEALQREFLEMKRNKDAFSSTVSSFISRMLLDLTAVSPSKSGVKVRFAVLSCLVLICVATRMCCL
jgi:hypothetical protein